jgi:hypothetical protein
MAIAKTFVETKDNFVGQLSIENAYWRVGIITGDKNKLSFVVHVSKDQQSKGLASKQYDFVPDMQGDNFIRQAYKHLKTLPEFSNAVDC